MRCFAAAVLFLAACGAKPAAPARPALASNVLRGDYVGSAECLDCHRDLHARWSKSPMHNMTRRAAGAEIRAPFDGSTFSFKGERATMSSSGGERFMELAPSARKFRVTKVIGGRTREDFVGTDGGEELVLPVSWIFATHSWRYKGYSVMVRERPRFEVGPVWRQTCIFCHNTVPYLSTVLDDLMGPGAPKYQGAVADRLLPPEKLWAVRPLDEAGLALAVAAEIRFLGGQPAGGLDDLLRGALVATRQRFGERHLVEVGIGCEACHLGARAHADDPKVRPSLAPSSPLLATGPPAPTHAELVNHTCARCHTVLFSHYPWTWEGGHRDAAGGGSTINSGEARDFLLGHCAKQLACTACHDPHTEDSRAKLDALATPAGNGLCLGCHAGVGAEHTHHRPDGEGSACLNCHMPKKNMGLGYSLTRYHRIGSPTETAKVLHDRPLECALCHADRSVRSLVETMERWWGKRYDREALRALYGDLDGNVVELTLARGLPHEQAVAIAVIGERRSAPARVLAPMLAHPYPLVRYFARHALELLLGRPLAIDLDAAPDEILRAAGAIR